MQILVLLRQLSLDYRYILVVTFPEGELLFNRFVLHIFGFYFENGKQQANDNKIGRFDPTHFYYSIEELHSYYFSYRPLSCLSLLNSFRLNIRYSEMAKYPPIWKGYYCDEDEDQNTIVLHLELNAFNIFNDQGKMKIQSQGKDEHGNITLDGEVDNQKDVNCVYKSPKRQLVFKGTLVNDGLIEGLWGTSEEDVGRGNFKLQRIQITPGWNGYFVQSDVHSHMKFDKLVIQAVPNGKVEGLGSDEWGQFSINGSFNTANNEVSFQKKYINGTNGEIAWAYWGTLNNQQVVGFWGYTKGEDQGSFKLTYYE